MIEPKTDRVLITGAAGAIGTALRNGVAPRLKRHFFSPLEMSQCAK
jgi:hypothetical protein